MLRRDHHHSLPREVQDALDVDASKILWIADELLQLSVQPSDRNTLVQLWRLCSTFTRMLTATGLKVGDAVHDQVARALAPLVTSIELAETSPNCWRAVAETFQANGHAKHERWRRSGTTLPWGPTQAFFNHFFRASGRESDTLSHSNIFKKMDLCFLVVGSHYFQTGSLAEMWAVLSPDFAPESDTGVVSLAMLTLSCPQFDQDTELLKTIFRFLFVESAEWYTRNGSWSYCTWLLFKRVVAHGRPGFLPFDDLAEPMFSSAMYALALQIGEDARQPLPVQGHVIDTIVAMTKNTENASISKLLGSMAYVLPNDMSSPLWNHLRRFLHATDVFLRPSASSHCCARLIKFLSSLVSSMLKRVTVQRKAPDTRPTPIEGYALSPGAIEAFVRLLLPPFLRLMVHKSKSFASEAQMILCRLSTLAPLVVFELASPLVLARMQSPEPDLAVVAMESLGHVTPEVSNVAPKDLSVLLSHVFASSVDQIDMNHLPRTMFATRLVFQSCLYLNLGAICTEEEMLQFFHKIFILAANMGATAKVSAGFFNAFRIIIRTLPQSTALGLVAAFVGKLRDQGDGSKLAAYGALLSTFAHVFPRDVLTAAVPLIRKNLGSRFASTAEVKWFGSLLCFALAGAGQESFAHRDAVVACVASLLERSTNRGRISMAGQILRRFTESLTVIRSDGHFADAATWSGGGDDGAASSALPQLRRFNATDVHVTWVTPVPAHVDFVVGLLDGHIRAVSAILRDVEGEVARRGAALGMASAEKAAAAAADASAADDATTGDDDEDEPLTVHSLLRCSVAWLHHLVSVALPFFPPAPDPQAVWWHCSLTPVQPFGTTTLSMTAVDLHDLLVTHTLHKVVGRDNHVLRQATSAGCALIRMDLVAEVYAQPNVKGAPIVMALLCLLCGADRVSDAGAFADGTATFFENWRRQLPAVGRMPRFYWHLSGEFAVWSRHQTSLTSMSARAYQETMAIAWELSFHRYATVGHAASLVLRKCQKLLVVAESAALIAAQLAEMQAVSTACDGQPVVAPQAGGAVRRIQHELVAAFSNLTHMTWWVSVLSARTDVLTLLLEFTENLHSTEQSARARCFNEFVQEYAMFRPSAAEFEAASGYLIAQASKLAFHKPQRAAACLDVLLHCYHHSLRAPLPAPLVQLVMKLAVNAHIRLRAPSFAILTMHFLALKAPRPKRETPVVYAESAYSGDYFAATPYYGLSKGLRFPPVTLVTRGDRPMRAADDPARVAVLAALDIQTDSAGRPSSSPWVTALLGYAIDHKSFSEKRAEFWKGMLLVTGVTPLLPVLVHSTEQLVASHMTGMRERLESQRGLFATVAEIVAGCYRATKLLPAERAVATQFMWRVVDLFLAPTTPHEVLSSLLQAIVLFKGCTTADELRAMYDRLFDLLEKSGDASSSSSSVSSQQPPQQQQQLSSQADVRVLSLLLQLVMGFAADISSQVLPHVVDRICAATHVFLCSTSSQTRNHAASVVRMCLHSHAFVSPLLASSTAHHAALRRLANLIFDTAAAVGLDAASVHKAVMALWALPNPAALVDVARFASFSAAALDVKRPEMDDLLSTANGTWTSVAVCRMPKALAADTVTVLCDFLGDSTHHNGRSSWAKAVFLRALRIVLYTNTHRIGKFAVIQTVADVAAKALECPDHRVRQEAMLLLSILTKVATEEQVQYLVLTRSKLLSAPDVPYAPVAALCGILQADPDTVPAYVPKLLTRMAPLARRSNSEVATVVKRMFLQWWRTHRDQWESEHQHRFTEAQKELLEELFKSPSYYV